MGPLHAELRLFAIAGEVTGPITEPASKDVFRFSNRGADLRAGVPLGDWSAYAGLGGGTTHTELSITTDGARIGGDNGYRYWLAGAGWARAPWLFTVEQNFSETYLAHLILAASYRW